MSPLGKQPVLIELMSSNFNHGLPGKKSSDGSIDLSSYESAQSPDGERSHGNRILVQEQLESSADSQWQPIGGLSSSIEGIPTSDPHFLGSMLKRPPDESEMSTSSQKKRKTDVEQRLSDNSVRDPPSSSYNSTLPRHHASNPLHRPLASSMYSAFEAAPVIATNAAGVGAGVSSYPGLDLYALRESAVANPALVANRSLAPADLALAEQLRLSSEMNAAAHHHEQLRDRYRHSALAALALQPPSSLESLFPASAGSSTHSGPLLPTPTSNFPSIVLAPIRANHLCHLALNRQHAAPVSHQPIYAALNSGGATTVTTPSSSANEQTNLELVMRQIAAVRNPGPFGGLASSVPADGGPLDLSTVAAARAIAASNSASAARHQAQLLGEPESQSIPLALLSSSRAGNPTGPSLATVPTSASSSSLPAAARSLSLLTGIADRMTTHLKPPFPPRDEDQVYHYTERPMFALGIDEDANWLSEFHCFVRGELTEVFRASHEDCKSRNNAITFDQVGIRCRFCAHKGVNGKVGRSSAFPSSCRQIYQSFTMMLREHFPKCNCIPPEVRQKFSALKDTPSQGATDSKRYWVYSAMRLGFTDTPEGIMISEASILSASKLAPFGNEASEPWPDDTKNSIALVNPSEEGTVDRYLFNLVSHLQVVHLTKTERIGNRRNVQQGLPGFACRFCCQHRRLGLCRLFPARRRTLPDKLNDMYDHIRRCSVTPLAIKEQLSLLKEQASDDVMSDRDEAKEFFDRVWSRMGHVNVSSTTAG